MSFAKGIFISYRRVDSQLVVGRLSDALKRALGDTAVFRDIYDIAPGTNFVEELDARLADCGVLLAVIGPEWVNQLKMRSERTDSIDYVLREIERAFARPIDIIPVLVMAASLPEEKDLPASLQPLARLQAHQLDDRSWRHDMQDLLTLLEKRTGQVAADPFKRYLGLWLGLRQLGANLVSRRTAAVSAAIAVVVAVGIGVHLSRENGAGEHADIAFLMRPHSLNSDALDEVQVFKDLRGVLKLALPESRVEVAPPASVNAEELDRYRQEEKIALLEYKGKHGYPRTFIHTRYSVDQATGIRRVLVTPYLRPTGRGEGTWKPVEGWPLRAYDGQASRRVAIKVGFELIEFLVAKGVLHLQAEEIRIARATLLDDFRGMLLTTAPSCDAERALLEVLGGTTSTDANAADADKTRKLLNTECPRDKATPDLSIKTAATLYGRALGQ